MICEFDFPDIDGGRWRARFSRPHRVLVAHTLDQVCDVIAQADQAARDEHWVAGFVAYDAASAFDAALQVNAPGTSLPLAVFAIYGAEEASVADAGPSNRFGCGPWALGTSRASIDAIIGKIRTAISDGDYYQVNYTTQLEAPYTGDVKALYDALREAQPDGYSAFIDAGAWEIASVSPELFFDWTPDRTLTTRPMKGTATPGPRAASELSVSAKERAENLMIVDLLRNDLARIAETGSVAVTSLFDIETLPTVLQMTSTVKCKTRAEITLLDVFRALFPCGSVTGAPKVAAMRAIAELETMSRGAYCGAIGVIRPNGHATFNVGIRTVTFDAKRGTASCGIGSGITMDSNAADEYAEWLVKRRFLLRATANFELLETLRLEDGNYWLLDRHLDRIRASAAHFGFVFDITRIHRALDQAAASKPQGLWRVRLMLARGGNPTTEALRLETVPEVVSVSLAMMAIDSDSEILRHKTTERTIYEPHAPNAVNVFDTLLFNERDEITEFTRGNVVVELHGQRVTPPVTCGLLPGVLRGELLDQGDVVERKVQRSELKDATRIWFINSVRGQLLAQLN